jgi:hypothetical protein
MNVLRTAERAWGVWRSHDARWLGARLLLEAYKRTGWEARVHRPRPWQREEWRGWVQPALASQSPALLLDQWRQGDGASWGRARRDPELQARLHDALGARGRAALLASAEEILAGRFTLFSRHLVDVGFPPDWGADPFAPDQRRWADDAHWSQVPMTGPRGSELKFIWELSRASWAFTLGRAYATSADDRFADGFWRLWTSWIDQNPPDSTVQWKDGQECALRVVATSFAVQLCAPSAATTPDRFASHLGAIAVMADRIQRGRLYAQLQHNNHSMSEAAGVYTAGVMYPVLRCAAEWRENGWKRLAGEVDRLVRSDGTFSQKSHNYHRVMLHDYLWAASVAESVGDRLDGGTRTRLCRAADYLASVVDPDCGEVPNFGANDGAQVLQLEQATYTDFRPTVACARYLAHGRGPAHGEPGEESALWLFGSRALAARPAPPEAAPGIELDRGGIYTLRQERSWVFAHAERFEDRPGQADQLHLDLWWRGINIARDPGTFVYFADPELYRWFRGSRCHNTVSVDERDQMEQGPRFLWATRAQGWARAGAGALLMGHDGYGRLSPPVSYEREVRALGADCWRVVDRLHSAGPHRLALHWLLPDLPHRLEGSRLTLETPQGRYSLQVEVVGATRTDATVHRAASGQEAWGWESRHYAERTPALSFLVTAEGAVVRFETVLSPADPPGRSPENVSS